MIRSDYESNWLHIVVFCYIVECCVLPILQGSIGIMYLNVYYYSTTHGLFLECATDCGDIFYSIKYSFSPSKKYYYKQIDNTQNYLLQQNSNIIHNYAERNDKLKKKKKKSA